MKILLGSRNPSKLKSLEMALEKIGVIDYSINEYDVPSDVNSKPIGFEIVRGAENRNRHLKEMALKYNIEYDYLCSLEGGYNIEEDGNAYVVTYCVIENKDGIKSFNKSLEMGITNEMFEYVRSGKSLNKIIEEIEGVENNKQNGGINLYLTNGIFRREDIDRDVVAACFVPFIFGEKRKILNDEVTSHFRERRNIDE